MRNRQDLIRCMQYGEGWLHSEGMRGGAVQRAVNAKKTRDPSEIVDSLLPPLDEREYSALSGSELDRYEELRGLLLPLVAEDIDRIPTATPYRRLSSRRAVDPWKVKA